MYWVCLYFTAVNPFEFISASLLNVWITCFYSLPVPFLAPVPCTLQRSQGFDHSCLGRTAVKVMSSCWALKLFSVELESHRPPGEPQVCSVNMANWREKNNTPGLTKEELTVFFSQKGVTLKLYVWSASKQAHPFLQPMTGSAITPV